MIEENVPLQEDVVVDTAQESVNAQEDAYIEQRMEFAFADDNAEQPAPQADVLEEDNLTQVELLATTSEPSATPENPFLDLGFNSKEELLAELTTLREAKPVVQETTYANEESKKVHQLIKDGKIKDVIDVYNKRELAEGFELLNDEQKIKLHIKMENPLFANDQELVDYHYKKHYVFDEDNFEGDEMELKIARLTAKQKSLTAIQTAEQTISKYKEIQLPDISVPTAVTQDKDYEAYTASVAKANEFTEKVIVPQTNSLKEEDLKMSFEINDPKAQMQFRVSVTPTKEHLEAAKNGVLNISDLIRSAAYDGNGNYNAAKAGQFALKALYFDDYVKSMMRQAVNAERKSRLSQPSNNGGGISKDFVIDNQMSDLDKMMEYRFS